MSGSGRLIKPIAIPAGNRPPDRHHPAQSHSSPRLARPPAYNDAVALRRDDEGRWELGGEQRVVVIGPAALRDTIVRALPNHAVELAEHLLDGVWRSGQTPPTAVIVSLAMGRRVLSAIPAVRRAAPHSRVVLACEARDEPLAVQALANGAHDYLVEPFESAEIQRALGVLAPARAAPPPPPSPPLDEIAALTHLTQSISAGPRQTLQHAAALIRAAFSAVGAYVEMDEVSAAEGDVSDPVFEQHITRHDQPVGRIVLARCAAGAYDASAAARLSAYAALLAAVVQQSRHMDQWRQRAWTDDLSGLRNRRYFDQALAEALEHAAQTRSQLTLVVFDVDDFKTYNDRQGHAVGDELIREIARLLLRCTREGDVVARLGGDEFAVLLVDADRPRQPGSEHPREPLALAERFSRAIAEHAFVCLGPGAPGPVTLSGGLACYPWNGATAEQITRAADDALLAAKRTGKNRIHLAGSDESQRRGYADAP